MSDSSPNIYGYTGSNWREVQLDPTTYALVTIPVEQHKLHAGSSFTLNWVVADLGAATTPTDMMTLSWKTPNTTTLIHMNFAVKCADGALLKFFEGKSGGGASPTGVIQSYNRNRGNSTASTILDVAGANASKVSYDATEFTGGVTLVDTVVDASGYATAFVEGVGRAENEFVLAANTLYQISLYETGNVPGRINMSWTEYANKTA